jgi:SPP1 gp7 family putative phage head morphogenesis protein
MSEIISELVTEYLPELLMGASMSEMEEEGEGSAQYQFLAALDEKTCEECAALDGEIFDELEVEELFDYTYVSEEELMANLHTNCRCELVMVAESEGLSLDESIFMGGEM